MGLQLVGQLSLQLQGFGQLAFQRLARLLETFQGLVDAFLALFPQALRQARHQPGQFVVNLFLWLALAGRDLVVQLLEVAMNGGFGTGIAHLDTYCINAGVVAARQDGHACRLHYSLVYTAPSHVFSCLCVM